MYIGDEHGISMANAAALEMVGFNSLEPLRAGMSDLDRRLEVRDPETRQRLAPEDQVFERALHGDAMTRDVLVRHQKTGADVVVRSSAAPIRLDDRIIGVVAINVDITARRRAEEVSRFLAEASAVLSSSLDTSTTLRRVAELAVPRLGDWCVVHLPTGSGTLAQLAVAHVDPAQAELLREIEKRYPLDPGAAGGPSDVYRTGVPRLAEDITHAMIEAYASSPAHRAELLGLRLRSSIVVPVRTKERILGTITLLTSEGGRRYGPEDVAIAEELAGRAAIAIENARLHEEVRASVRRREDILAIVAHDLKNPLTAVLMGATQILRRKRDDWEQLNVSAQRILRSAERMDRMTRDLLDLASIQAGRLTIDLAEHDPATLLAEAVEMMQPLASERSLRLGPTQPVRVRCDRQRVLQVLSNLIGNAVKFTPPGATITVESRVRPTEIQISVRDTGIGIPEGELEQIFDRYWQAPGAERKAGVGLGLAIARAIVEAHGGHIWATSEVGVGSTFSFTLPRAP